jgi:CheY-like chemotaxis protein
LVQAISSGDVATAIGAAEVLGEIGSPALLAGLGGRRSALAEAARHPDRRVRFAAIDAILKLKPMTSFAGASAVGDGLKFFAGTSGQRKALVAHPRSAAARQIAGYLSQLGYEVEIATNGRDAFAVATSSPDIELAFIHTALDHPRADDLLAQFRKDPRTAKLPVALIALPNFPETAERLARGVPRCHAFAEPQDAAGLKYQAERLLSMPDCQPVPPEIRQHHAVRAIVALVQFAEQPVPWLDARAISRSVERSLDYPAMTAAVASMLASTGTASGQSELVQLVARESLPLATRELAAIAFARSVAKFGILLTSDQILAQYDRYNTNAGRNRDTHKVMLVILEAMEAKSEEEGRNSDE